MFAKAFLQNAHKIYIEGVWKGVKNRETTSWKRWRGSAKLLQSCWFICGFVTSFKLHIFYIMIFSRKWNRFWKINFKLQWRWVRAWTDSRTRWFQRTDVWGHGRVTKLKWRLLPFSFLTRETPLGTGRQHHVVSATLPKVCGLSVWCRETSAVISPPGLSSLEQLRLHILHLCVPKVLLQAVFFLFLSVHPAWLHSKPLDNIYRLFLFLSQRN